MSSPENTNAGVPQPMTLSQSIN